jgi:tRNA(fMet)-specific endonuclease VapC
VLYHLDTNVCVAALKGVMPVQERLRAHADDVAISTIVLGELYCGVFRSQRVAHNLEVLAEFVAGIEVIEFDTNAA